MKSEAVPAVFSLPLLALDLGDQESMVLLPLLRSMNAVRAGVPPGLYILRAIFRFISDSKVLKCKN